MDPYAHHQLPLDRVPQMTLRELVPYSLALETRCVCGRITGNWLRLLLRTAPGSAGWPIVRVARALRCRQCGQRPRTVVLLDLNEHAPVSKPPDLWAVALVTDASVSMPASGDHPVTCVDIDGEA